MKKRNVSWPTGIGAMATLAVGLSALAPQAFSQASATGDWPAKPITILVGFPPGQSSDTSARMIADSLSHGLGQAVIVENKPGQAGSIAASLLKRAPADGYTMALMATAALTTNPHLYRSITYDSLADFAPVSQITTGPLLLVANQEEPFSTIQEFVEYAKARPGKLNYCSTGNGTISHLAMESFQDRAGISLEHIPYQGSAAAMNDLGAGRVSVCFDTVSGTLPLLSSGKIKALAVTSKTRSRVYPDTPTVDESGYPGFEAAPYIGLLYPAATPAAVVQRLSDELQKVRLQPNVRAQIESAGSTAIFSTPAEFAAEIRADHEKWGRVIRDMDLKLD